MDYEQIKYETKDGILTITLNRPDKLNAFTGKMLSELLDAMDRSDRDDDVRAVVFTGAGRGFCAGADLSGGANTFNAENRGPVDPGLDGHRDGGGLFTLRLYDSLKPTIAACNGPAVGVGITMQLAMDVRLASEAARYGFVFTRRAIVMEACSSWFLPRLVGPAAGAGMGDDRPGLPGRRGAQGPAGALGPQAGRAAAGGLCAGARDRRQHRAGLGRAQSPDDLEDAGRRPSDGSAQGRFQGHLCPRQVGRREGGRDRLPREATGPIPDEGQRRHAVLLSVVEGADVRSQPSCWQERGSPRAALSVQHAAAQRAAAGRRRASQPVERKSRLSCRTGWSSDANTLRRRDAVAARCRRKVLQQGASRRRDVDWTIDRAASWRFRTGYNLHRDDGIWRIVVCTAFQETAARQRGG